MRRYFLWFLAALQIACAAVFLYEIVASILGIRIAVISWELREIFEILAVCGLLLGSYFGFRAALSARREADRAKEALKIATGAIAQSVDERFGSWGLTDAENQVGWLLIKGFDLAEIGRIRGTSEGTVKAQCNAIYRKSGSSGRAQLLAGFVEDLFDDRAA